MRSLTGQSIPNIDTTDTDYPYGRAQNESTPGALDGTPMVEEVHGIGDAYQANIELLRLAGITPDENPERKDNSQVVTAMKTLFRSPVAIISCAADVAGGATVTELEKVLGNQSFAYALTQLTWDSTNGARLFNLNITSGGDHIVHVQKAGIGYSGSVNEFSAGHSNTTGLFDNNNAAGNIHILDPNEASGTVNNIWPYFTLFIYEVV